MFTHFDLAQHMAAEAAGAATFMLVLCLRLYFLRHADPLPPWQRRISKAIDRAGLLLCRVAEALLIAVLVGLFTETGVIGILVACIKNVCGV